MSTSSSAVHGVADAAPVERRFYRRTTPSKLLYVAFGADNLGMLVNISESGLMVSTPERLPLNSVFRVELHLNGLSNTIKVHVRTVWTADLQKRSGIQLLDLSEPDRELIRKWGRQQLPRDENPDEINSPEKLESSFEAEPQPVHDEPGEEVKFVAAVVPPLSFEGLGMDHFGNDLVAIPGNDLPPRKNAGSSKLLLLIAWSAAMAAVCLGTGWSYRRELADRFIKQPAHQTRATFPAKEDSNVGADGPASVAPVINVTPVPSAAAPGTVQAKTATAADPPLAARSNASDEGTLEADPVDRSSGSAEKRSMGYERNLNSPLKQSREAAERPVPPEISDSTTSPMKSPMKNGIASTATPGEARSSAKISTPVPVEGDLSASTPEPVPVEPRLSANGSAPAQVELRTPTNGGQAAVETRPSVNAAEQSPAQNRPVANAGPTFTSNAKVLSVDPPIRSAITGSIARGNPGRFRPSVSPQPNSSSFAATSSANLTANQPISHSASNAVDRSSKPPVIQMDVPAARVVELTSTSHSASFVLLSGEQVLKSNALTIHVRRSVRVPGDHWLLWRSHKRVVLGGLTSRVDPQIPRTPNGSGTITVQATIAEDGQVISVKPLNGNLAFLSNVTTAVSEWRYEPTYVDNKPVETQAQIELDFHPVTTLRASQR